MNLASFLALLIVAFVAGFVYNWITPRIQPMLPAAVTSHVLLRTVATGVFILLAVAVAHFAARLVSGRRELVA